MRLGVPVRDCSSAARLSTPRASLAHDAMTTYPAEQLIPRMRGRLHVFAFWGARRGLRAGDARAVGNGPGRLRDLLGPLCARCSPSAPSITVGVGARAGARCCRRLDHSTIHVFIAASTTPLAVLVVDGRMQTFVLACAGLGALGGIALSLAWDRRPACCCRRRQLRPRGLGRAGRGAPASQSALTAPRSPLAAGAIVYIAGAAVYATRRPNPMAGRVRLPRGLPRAVGDRRDQPGLRRLRRLGRARRLGQLVS